AEGSGLPGGRTAEHAVSATTARASSLTAERPADRFRATLRYTRTCHATFFKWITDVVVLCRGPELNWRHMVLQPYRLWILEFPPKRVIVGYWFEDKR